MSVSLRTMSHCAVVTVDSPTVVRYSLAWTFVPQEAISQSLGNWGRSARSRHPPFKAGARIWAGEETPSTHDQTPVLVAA